MGEKEFREMEKILLKEDALSEVETEKLINLVKIVKRDIKSGKKENQ